MSELLDFLKTHEEAFRSRARLASLYSDFRFQRTTNPDGYEANSSAWLRALSAATQAGLVLPHADDRLILHCGEELAVALQTPELGRPLAIGAVIGDAITKKELVPLQEFLNAKLSIYARSWIPTPWQVASWGLRRLGLLGEGSEDRLRKADFVVVRNVEAAAKAVLAQASSTVTSNSSGIYSRELFASTFASALGSRKPSANDLSVLLTHLSRDRQAIVYSASLDVIKFKSATQQDSTSISEEDVSIASLRTLMASLESQIIALTAQVQTFNTQAREAVASKQIFAAKSELRKKKAADTRLQQRIATLAQLEDVYGKIEQAADQVEIVKVMSAAGQTLKSLNKQTGGVEKVQDIMDDLREEMVNADEIGAAINEVSAGEIDEGEVDEEFEAMERAEKEKREAVELAQRKKREAAEQKEREIQNAAEVEETRRKLAELDQLGKESEEPEIADSSVKKLPTADKIGAEAL